MCRHICVTNGNCSITNYNRAEKLCLISDNPCLVLQKDTHYEVNYISIRNRDSCIQWISNSNFAQAAYITSLDCDINGSERPCYVGCRVSTGHILPGKYHRHDSRGREGVWTVLDGQAYTTGTMEILDVQTDCQVAWMSFTARDPVPFSAVAGGYMTSDNSMLYVIRGNVHDNGNMFTVFGYYDPANERGYLAYFGVRTLTIMDILILIWNDHFRSGVKVCPKFIAQYIFKKGKNL